MLKNIGYNVLEVFKLRTFTSLNQFQINFHVPMIYYEFFCISKLNIFNTKLNYQFKT